MSVELEEKHTEASVLALLRKRHAAKNGNGPEWADVEKVRDAPGFDAMRTADAMALGLWKSRGHELHGFEVKVSRSDWRRELADPAKAEGWCEIVDRWWIVAPRGVVPRDELPATGDCWRRALAGSRSQFRPRCCATNACPSNASSSSPCSVQLVRADIHPQRSRSEGGIRRGLRSRPTASRHGLASVRIRDGDGERQQAPARGQRSRH